MSIYRICSCPFVSLLNFSSILFYGCLLDKFDKIGLYFSVIDVFTSKLTSYLLFLQYILIL